MFSKVLIVLLASVSLVFGQAKKNLEYSGFFDTYYFPGSWSFNGGLGFGLYGGDLATVFDGNTIQPSFFLGVGYKPLPKIQIGFQYGAVNLGANDNQGRSLSFSGTLHEFNIYGRYYFIDDIIRTHPQFLNKKPKLVKPYATLGIAPVYINSDLSSADSTILSSDNSSMSVVLPLGLGVQLDFSKRVALILDVNYRVTFTDKIDAYTPAQSTANDAYASFSLSLQYSPWGQRIKKKKFKAKKAGEGGSYGSPSSSTGSDSTSVQKVSQDIETSPDEGDVDESVSDEDVELNDDAEDSGSFETEDELDESADDESYEEESYDEDETYDDETYDEEESYDEESYEDY